jgi:nicotinamidase-related amidase
MEHEWRIDAREYARHESRRGRRHAYSALDPARTALVVVDMIPFFVDENPYARGIVPNVNRLAGAVRDRGGHVAWVVPAPAEPTVRMREFFGDDVAVTYAASPGEGPPTSRLAAALDRDARDLVVEKSATSAFFPGRSPLADRLARLGVENVVVAGTVANVCCEATARDAATLGHRVVMVADANAAVCDAHLNATLCTVYRSFGDVRTTSETVALLTA